MKLFLKSHLPAISLVMVLAHTAFAAPPTTAGFIQDQPPLEPVPGVEGAWGWEAAGDPIAKYDKVILDNIEIFLAPDSPYKGIDASQMDAISKTMSGLFHEELEPAYPIVSKAGPGVMRASMAITNVMMTKKKRSLLGYTPVGLLVGGVRSVADALSNISLEKAIVEAVFTDSVTGERLVVRIATKPFSQAGVGEGEMSWEALESAFRFYAQTARKVFDKAHGK